MRILCSRLTSLQPDHFISTWWVDVCPGALVMLVSYRGPMGHDGICPQVVQQDVQKRVHVCTCASARGSGLKGWDRVSGRTDKLSFSVVFEDLTLMTDL